MIFLFKPSLALLEAELAPVKDWEEVGNNFRKFLGTCLDDDDDDLL